MMNIGGEEACKNCDANDLGKKYTNGFQER